MQAIANAEKVKTMILDAAERAKHWRGKDVDTLETGLTEIQDKVAKAFEEAGTDVDLSKVTSLEAKGDGATVLGELQKLSDEAAVMKAVIDEKHGLSRIQSQIMKARDDDDDSDGSVEGLNFAWKTIGDSIVETKEFQAAFKASGDWSQRGFHAEIGGDIVDRIVSPMNATFKTTAGWPPEVVRSGRVVLSEQPEVQLLDLLPMIRVRGGGYKWMQETTFTNSVAGVAEEAALPQSTLALTEKSTSINRVGTYIPVTDEQLQDETGARDYLQMRIPFMVRRKLSDQVLNGNGSTPNLDGLINETGIGTQAKTNAISVLDVFLKARTKIRTAAYLRPDSVLIGPDNYESMLLTKDSDGRYLFGGPTAARPPSIWGISIVESDDIAANTAFMGAFRTQAALLMGRTLSVDVGLVNDDFIRNKQTFRAYLRTNVVMFRPKAFCKLTSLNA